ncbi:hypothetical protein GCM10010503_36880 [Streptomyces lucensis JCM 4490]|uniref:Uncharacterized protein n=1 Tax=Streptomyces lucensis JCM 4490 TaxID=1306176 RepID=A0A918J7T3_9ACTN|nr:hypothetical protein GCM10010503_36880 [Streptomyces lucensis JCM 4490]
MCLVRGTPRKEDEEPGTAAQLKVLITMYAWNDPDSHLLFAPPTLTPVASRPAYGTAGRPGPLDRLLPHQAQACGTARRVTARSR